MSKKVSRGWGLERVGQVTVNTKKKKICLSTKNMFLLKKKRMIP